MPPRLLRLTFRVAPLPLAPVPSISAAIARAIWSLSLFNSLMIVPRSNIGAPSLGLKQYGRLHEGTSIPSWNRGLKAFARKHSWFENLSTGKAKLSCCNTAPRSQTAFIMWARYERWVRWSAARGLCERSIKGSRAVMAFITSEHARSRSNCLADNHLHDSSRQRQRVESACSRSSKSGAAL